MTGHRVVDPSDDLIRVLSAITRRALIRRQLPDLAARLDDPTATVRVELDDEDATRVFVDGQLATVVPRTALEHAMGLARAGRASPS